MAKKETKNTNQTKTKQITQPYTTTHMAKDLGLTKKQLRRYLRKLEKYQDGVYTNYQWSTKKDYERDLGLVKRLLEKKEIKAE